MEVHLMPRRTRMTNSKKTKRGNLRDEDLALNPLGGRERDPFDGFESRDYWELMEEERNLESGDDPGDGWGPRW